MKVAARHVRFLPLLPWFNRRRLRMVGRSNTVQLLETALVIEGLQQTIGMWLVDLLFQQALSEWTTVTVPYSRIVRWKYSRRWLAKGVFAVLVWGPLFFLLATTIPNLVTAGPSGIEGLMLLPFLIGYFCLTLYFQIRFLSARNVLVYRRADGKQVTAAFRIRSGALQKAFAERLAANRRAAADLVRPAAAAKGR